MKPQTDIYTYYNNLAKSYDENRFANSYGKFLHQQESKFLIKNINPDYIVLDLGCGTGRHLHHATHGLDLSENMIAEAKNKFYKKKLMVGSAFEIPFNNNYFDQVFSFHVLMHLNIEEILKAIEEAYRVIKPGGNFIFDIPSDKRRKMINYKANNWHGATSFSISEIKNLIDPLWKIKKIQGVLFMPIHHFPNRIRKIIFPIDNVLCKSFFKEYASYLMVVLEKK